MNSTPGRSGRSSFPSCPCRAVDPGNAWGNKPDFVTRLRYHVCHGVVPREELFAKGIIWPGDTEQDPLLGATLAAHTMLPLMLRGLKETHDRDRQSRVTTMMALTVFRDMRNEVGRTALHSAAAMDRDASCKALLALGCDPAVRDRYMISALQLMVKNIPQSAAKALDQFHFIDRSARQQRYFLPEPVKQRERAREREKEPRPQQPVWLRSRSLIGRALSPIGVSSSFLPLLPPSSHSLRLGPRWFYADVFRPNLNDDVIAFTASRSLASPRFPSPFLAGLSLTTPSATES